MSVGAYAYGGHSTTQETFTFFVERGFPTDTKQTKCTGQWSLGSNLFPPPLHSWQCKYKYKSSVTHSWGWNTDPYVCAAINLTTELDPQQVKLFFLILNINAFLFFFQILQ